MQLNKTNQGAQGAAAEIAEVASYLWQKGWAEASGGNISVNVTEFYPGIRMDFRTYPMIPLEVNYPAIAHHHEPLWVTHASGVDASFQRTQIDLYDLAEIPIGIHRSALR